MDALTEDEKREIEWQIADIDNDLGQPQVTPFSYRVVAMEDFPIVEKPAALCGDWLRAGSLTLFHSRGGAGKTAVMADMIYAMKARTPWLDQDTCDPGKVLWVNGDMDHWQINERLGFLKPNMTDLLHIPFVNMMERSQETIELCTGYDMVVLDNRGCLFDLADANAAESWVDLVNVLRRIAHSGTTVILLSHSGKGEQFSAFGSSSQEWLVDTVVGITTKDKQKTIVWQKVRGPQPDDTDFTLVMNDGRLQAVKGQKEEVVVTDNRQAFLDYLYQYGPITWNDMRSDCRRTEGPLFISEGGGRRVLDKLDRDGLVRQENGKWLRAY